MAEPRAPLCITVKHRSTAPAPHCHRGCTNAGQKLGFLTPMKLQPAFGKDGLCLDKGSPVEAHEEEVKHLRVWATALGKTSIHCPNLLYIGMKRDGAGPTPAGRVLPSSLFSKEHLTVSFPMPCYSSRGWSEHRHRLELGGSHSTDHSCTTG